MTKRVRTIRAQQHGQAGIYRELRSTRNPEARANMAANRVYRARYGI